MCVFVCVCVCRMKFIRVMISHPTRASPDTEDTLPHDMPATWMPPTALLNQLQQAAQANDNTTNTHDTNNNGAAPTEAQMAGAGEAEGAAGAQHVCPGCGLVHPPGDSGGHGSDGENDKEDMELTYEEVTPEQVGIGFS